MEGGRLSPQQLRRGRPLAVDEALLVVEHRTRVLHTAEGKRRREEGIVFVERVRDPEPVAQPAERPRIHRDQRVTLRLRAPRLPHH